MTYKLTTGDGMVLYVDGVDLELVTAYLVLHGCPPVNVEVEQPQSPAGCGSIPAS